MPLLHREIGSTLAKLKLQLQLQQVPSNLTELWTLQRSLIVQLEAFWNTQDLATSFQDASSYRELANLIGTSRIVHIAAQTDDVLQRSQVSIDPAWISDGGRYTQWLVKGLVHFAKGKPITNTPMWDHLSDLLGRSLVIGYPDLAMMTLTYELLSVHPASQVIYQKLLGDLTRPHFRTAVLTMVNVIAFKCFNGSAAVGITQLQQTQLIPCYTALLGIYIAVHEDDATHYLTEFVQRADASSDGFYQALCASLPTMKLLTALERLWELFMDPLYIDRKSVSQQEAHLRCLLIALSHFRDSKKPLLKRVATSSLHLQGMSTRLSSTSGRKRFLGMAFGQIISGLIDDPHSLLSFDFSEEQAAEVSKLASLILLVPRTYDIEQFGWPDMFRQGDRSTISDEGSMIKAVKPRNPPFEVIPSSTTKIHTASSKDISSSDSDDSDDEPGASRRIRPLAYVRDLIAALRDTGNEPRLKAALKEGPMLIRRKANFGSELRDSVVDLCILYANLHDPAELNNFEEMKTDGMTALVSSHPDISGSWFAEQCYWGDYSVSQRACMFVALALGSQELCGWSRRRAPETFPSKRLPPQMSTSYSSQVDFDQTVREVNTALLSSAKSEKAAVEQVSIRSSNVPAAHALFFPLLAHFVSYFNAIRPSGRPLRKELLPLSVKTLTVIYVSIGPCPASLTQMTSEYWEILLSNRPTGIQDSEVLRAMLAAFLALIEANPNRRQTAELHSHYLVETFQWTGRLLEDIDPGYDEEVTVLTTAVFSAARKVIQGYDRIILGGSVD